MVTGLRVSLSSYLFELMDVGFLWHFGEMDGKQMVQKTILKWCSARRPRHDVPVSKVAFLQRRETILEES